jgi:hypothetical protein
MKKFLISFIFQIIFINSYSQNLVPRFNERSNNKKDLDSLSKLYRMEVIGYWYSSIQNKKSITLWYEVGKVRKDTTILLSQNIIIK